jgi:hypothetical protein
MIVFVYIIRDISILFEEITRSFSIVQLFLTVGRNNQIIFLMSPVLILEMDELWKNQM